MKKFLLSAMALVAAMSVNAQVFQVNGSEKGLSSDLAPVEAGYAWGSIEGAIDISNAFATDHKVVDCKNNDFNKVVIDGAEILTKDGVQGNDNPKDADGTGVGASLKEPVSGAVIQIDAKKDGWVYIVSKLSTNKQYVVFEEGSPMGYKIAMENATEDVINIEVKGEGEYNYLDPAKYEGGLPWVIRIFKNNNEAESAGNGLGVFYFPVAEGCKYYASASGSKISWSGIYFSENEAKTITVEGEGISKTLVGSGDTPTPVEAEVWTIAGGANLVGSSWDTADTSNDLKTTDGKTYTLVKEGVVLEKGINYEYKVAKDHAWTEAYPSSNAILTVEETGTYTVTFTFNAETKEVSAKAEKTGEATIAEKTYSVIGTINGNWDNDTPMEGGFGIYMATFNNVKAGTYEFKIRVDGKWDEAYPSSNYQLVVEKDGSTVIIGFYEETKEVKAIVQSAVIGAEDNSTPYLGDRTILLPLSNVGGGCSFKFNNYSSKANNWNNWVAVITNNYDEPFAEGAVKIALRADNWENIQFSNEGISSNFNWDTFKDDMDGSTVDIKINRDANGDVTIHADITTAAGTKYFEEFTKNLGTEGVLYACLSVDGSHLVLLPQDETAIQSTKAQAKAGIRYNLAGQKVDANYKGIVIENGKKFMVK